MPGFGFGARPIGRRRVQGGSASPPVAAAPTLASPATAPADPRVGIAASGIGATFTGAENVVHEVFADGAKVTDGTSYTPVAGDFNKVLEYRSTATSAGGTLVSRAYAPVTALFDSFTANDNTPLLSRSGEQGTTWQKHGDSSYGSDVNIVGNKIGRGSTAGTGGNFVYGFSPATANYVTEAVFTTGSTLAPGGFIAFRASSTARTFYSFGLSATGTWGLNKRVNNAGSIADIVNIAPYNQAPFGTTAPTFLTTATASPVRPTASGSFPVQIHVWDENDAVQFAIYVAGCLIIRAQDASATRITAPGVVGWWDNQSAAVTATTGNKLGPIRVHNGRLATALTADGRNLNTARIDDKPLRAVKANGSLDLRGAAIAYAADDNGIYTREIGGWCEGGTTDVKVRVEKAIGGDTVIDWVTPTGLVIAGPRWFGTIDLPRDKPSTNSAGDAWDVLRFRMFRGATMVRTGTSARFGNGIGVTVIGSSISAQFMGGDAGPNGMSTAGLTANPNTALMLRYAGSYFFLNAADSSYAVIAERPTIDFAPYGWRIAYAGAVGANVMMGRLQAEFGGIVFGINGGVSGSAISGAGGTASNQLDAGGSFSLWSNMLTVQGGVNVIAVDFGVNEARQQVANGGILTRADMLGRWTSLLAAIRGISGHMSVPIIIRGSPSDGTTGVTSGANNPGNCRRARQAEIDATAYDAATYRGPVQFDALRVDNLHPDTIAVTGTQMTGARTADYIIPILKNVAGMRLTVTGAAKVSNTQTRFTVSGIGSDELTTRTGVPGWEIATGSDLDAGAVAVSAAVYEGTTGATATYLVSHASTMALPYRAGYGEAPAQGTGGVSSADTVSLRDVRSPYPRAVEQTAGRIPVST